MKIIVLLSVVISIFFTSVGATCNSTNVYFSYESAYVKSNYTITFDDQGWNTEVPTTLSTPLVLSPGPITIRISGTNCEIRNSLSWLDGTVGEGAYWNGSALWDTSNSFEVTGPGYYMTTTAADSVCTFEFDPPVSQIQVRTMCGKYVFGSLKIYDKDNIEMGCLPQYNAPGQNVNFQLWYTGLSKQIAKLEYTGGLFAIDEIDLRSGCKEGEFWNITRCSDYDECLFGYCNENANCISPNNIPQCTCKPGFVGDGIGQFGCDDLQECLGPVDTCPNGTLCSNEVGGFLCYCDTYYFEYGVGTPENVTCIDIDECARTEGAGGYPCDSNATCTNKYGGYQCTCNAGYEGDGLNKYFGTGCKMIDLCTNPDACSPLATSCESYNGVTLNCTCPAGYEGDGVGKDGCSLIIPTAPQSNTNVPITAKVSGASLLGGYGRWLNHVLLMCFVISAVFNMY